jgi:hypothetical protein
MLAQSRVAVYIFHFQFCNNGLFQGYVVTALTDDITYNNTFLNFIKKCVHLVKKIMMSSTFFNCLVLIHE